MKHLEKLLEWGGIKKDILLLAVSGLALLVSLFAPEIFPFDAAWIAIIFCGVPIILEAVIGLVTAFDIKADVLVSIALIASVCIGEDFAAGEVAFIMQLGGLLEDLTVAKARAGIEKLVHLTPQTARVVENGSEKIIPAEEVKAGDILRVQPGETIPVDGILLSGQTSVNQAVMTGESLPVDKTAGDEVSSGTVNQYGAFEMKAVKVGEDSSIQRMIRLVQSADAGKAKIVGLADRWATWIVVIALTAAALTWKISGEIIRAVTILVVFCPCALVLATPTAIMAAIGNATKHGFLVREGDALERLAQVKRIAFDKTGTLTCGTLMVTAVKTFAPGQIGDRLCGGKLISEVQSAAGLAEGDDSAATSFAAQSVSGMAAEGSRSAKAFSVANLTEDELFEAAASAELLSEHPLGKAIVSGYKQKTGRNPERPEDFSMMPGLGICAVWHGKKVTAGNRRLLEQQGIVLPEEAGHAADFFLAEGGTAVYVGMDGSFQGFLVLSDTLRPESGEMIRRIKEAGVRPLLLTGDNKNAAYAIAGQLGIDDCHAGCLPEDKLNWIGSYQNRDEPICMIGDGVNDAPALKKAMVGIAMGGVGSDIAVDAADIVLVDDEVKELPHLLKLSQRMMRTIRHNLTFSLTLNFIAIILAITGILDPVVGALVHNAGSVFVIINSALLLRWRSNAR